MKEQDVEQMNRRERVRALMIAPLEAAGMRKARGQSDDDHAAFLKALAVRLAYLEPGDFPALVNWAEMNGEGKAKDVWPSEIAFVRAAHALRRPPDHVQPMIVRWMRSEAGRAARQASEFHLAAALGYMRQNRRPPNFERYGVAAVNREAEEMRLIIERAQRAADNGVERPDLEDAAARVRRLVAEALSLVEGQGDD